MDIRTQRFVDRWVGIPVCALLSAFHAMVRRIGADDHATKEPRRILIILLSEMGSLVLAEPMLRTLRTRHPHADLYFMLFAKNRQVLDLLGVVDPDHVIEVRDGSAVDLAKDLYAASARRRSTRSSTANCSRG